MANRRAIRRKPKSGFNYFGVDRLNQRAEQLLIDGDGNLRPPGESLLAKLLVKGGHMEPPPPPPEKKRRGRPPKARKESQEEIMERIWAEVTAECGGGDLVYTSEQLLEEPEDLK